MRKSEVIALFALGRGAGAGSPARPLRCDVPRGPWQGEGGWAAAHAAPLGDPHGDPARAGLSRTRRGCPPCSAPPRRGASTANARCDGELARTGRPPVGETGHTHSVAHCTPTAVGERLATARVRATSRVPPQESGIFHSKWRHVVFKCTRACGRRRPSQSPSQTATGRRPTHSSPRAAPTPWRRPQRARRSSAHRSQR